MIIDKNGKRLVIFFFYDKQGIVDRYIDYLLDDINKNADQLMVVCNGTLDEKGREIFEKYTKDIIVRENVGFDVWAYKTALETIGYDNLGQYSEVVMMNFTIMGPVYPFSEAFQTMNQKDLDFWGMTMYNKAPFDPFKTIKFGYIPTHLQSHFIVIRNTMLTSPEFIEYWKNMPMINSYEEAVGCHEAIFTKTFEDYGYKWEAYVDTTDTEKNCDNPLAMKPVELIRDRHCPIFKRRSFFQEYYYILEHTMAEPCSDLMEYLKTNTQYDVNMIYENILRTENQADIKQNLHLDYILPIDVDNTPAISIDKKRIALVIHMYFDDLIQYCYNYVLSMPESSDIYITTDTQAKKQAIEEKFNGGPWNSVKVILIENRGRDVSSLLVGVKEYVMNYDYVCFMHDKKVAQLDAGIKGEAFSYKCFENLLKSKIYVKNIINTFEKNEKLGMLMPPPPNHADYYPVLGKGSWGSNYDNTKELADKLGLTVKMEDKKEPIAPLGTMFWFRPESLKLLYDCDWEYEDFPKEPNNIDGTILHAIERIYSYVVQQEGYYPAWVLNTQCAAVELDNHAFRLRELNDAAFDVYGVSKHVDLIDHIKEAKMYGGRRGFSKLYLQVNGIYSEDDTEIAYIEPEISNYFEYRGLMKYGELKQVRWDPSDYPGTQVSIEDIKLQFVPGEVVHPNLKDIKTNGIKIGASWIFFTSDSQVYIEIPDKGLLDSISISATASRDLSEDVMQVIEGKFDKKLRIKNMLKRLLKK